MAKKKEELEQLRKLKAGGAREELAAAQRELKARDQQPGSPVQDTAAVDSREVLFTDAMNEHNVGDRIEKAQATQEKYFADKLDQLSEDHRRLAKRQQLLGKLDKLRQFRESGGFELVKPRPPSNDNNTIDHAQKM